MKLNRNILLHIETGKADFFFRFKLCIMKWMIVDLIFEFFQEMVSNSVSTNQKIKDNLFFSPFSIFSISLRHRNMRIVMFHIEFWSVFVLINLYFNKLTFSQRFIFVGIVLLECWWFEAFKANYIYNSFWIPISQELKHWYEI